MKPPQPSCSSSAENPFPIKGSKSTGIANKEKMTRLQQLCHQLPKLFLPFLQGPALTTFSLFSKLPIEIRHMIWKHVAMVSRTIELTTEYLDRQSYEFQSRAPAIMHTSQESRSEGKRYYQRCVEKASDDPSLRAVPNIIWTKFAVDWISFRPYSSTDPAFELEKESLNFDESVLHQICRLGILDHRCLRPYFVLPKIKWLSQLQQLCKLAVATRTWQARCYGYIRPETILEKDQVHHIAKKMASDWIEKCLKDIGLKNVQLRVGVPYEPTEISLDFSDAHPHFTGAISQISI